MSKINLNKFFANDIAKIKKDMYLYILTKVAKHYKIMPCDLEKKYKYSEIKLAYITLLIHEE